MDRESLLNISMSVGAVFMESNSPAETILIIKEIDPRIMQLQIPPVLYLMGTAFENFTENGCMGELFGFDQKSGKIVVHYISPADHIQKT